ncbi:MAG: hypothetical protein JWP44_1096 [Mucilaginibacter sp.]|nr:hypothetical protein [Mucilaginibacter sp.]
MRKIICCIVLYALPIILKAQDTVKTGNGPGWQLIKTQGVPEKREDCSFAEVNGLFYLVGGRGIKPVDVFDPKTSSWQHRNNTPIELNHFQAVVYKNKIYAVGAMNGRYPHEKPLENIYSYDTQTDKWQDGPPMPPGRLRGSGGTVVYKDKIYLACGIQDGHYEGSVGWLDVYDPATGKWQALPDAPHARDHFNAVVIGDRLYLAGGRRTSAKTQQVAQLTVPEIDVYDFKQQSWQTLPADKNLPTLRAGCTAVTYKKQLVIIGGESVVQKESHHEAEAYNTKTEKWARLPALVTGRHDTGALFYKNKIYIVAGSANSGGGPDQNTIEMLKP